MYDLKLCDVNKLQELDKKGLLPTVFFSYPWIKFLIDSIGGEPVVLSFADNGSKDIVGYFVGMVTKKFGLRILGSPFEGWLTCDMGFIRCNKFDINTALLQLKEYAFDELKCVYVQITDKEIEPKDLNSTFKFYETDILVKDISGTQEDVLNSFSKQAKRYVRQFNDRETVETVAFDEKFVDVYYPQLIDIFARQNLKPTFTKEKIYKLAEAFKDYPQMVLAQKSITSEGICNGTALTFGKGNWCYYLCAANTRETANAHPGEGLFWEMTKHWNAFGIPMMDLVGVRDYKMRYNPVVKKAVTVYFERIPGMYKGKTMAKHATQVIRKCRGVLNTISV